MIDVQLGFGHQESIVSNQFYCAGAPIDLLVCPSRVDVIYVAVHYYGVPCVRHASGVTEHSVSMYAFHGSKQRESFRNTVEDRDSVQQRAFDIERSVGIIYS